MSVFDPRNMRLVKIPLEVSLIRQMDELVLEGIGGYSDRNDFIRDAISSLVMETRYPIHNLSEQPGKATQVAHKNASRNEALDNSDKAPRQANNNTTITWPAEIKPIDHSDAEPLDIPLLGLHNRDFPSLWATARIAAICSNNAQDINFCFDEVVRTAWEFGKQLQTLESTGSQRYSALFPTNSKKRTSCENAFRTFAMGRVISGTILKTVGPLFQWRICGLIADAKGPRIGILRGALNLFKQLVGISAESPHSQDHALAFLEHLRSNASADFSMLMFILEVVSKKPTRQYLVTQVTTRDNNWSPEQGNSFAAGYVARAREWGLVEPKMLSGAYILTKFGEDVRRNYATHTEVSK